MIEYRPATSCRRTLKRWSTRSIVSASWAAASRFSSRTPSRRTSRLMRQRVRARKSSRAKCLCSRPGSSQPEVHHQFPDEAALARQEPHRGHQAGLQALVEDIRERGIRSIAVPPLGSGLGGLDWRDVRPRIEAALPWPERRSRHRLRAEAAPCANWRRVQRGSAMTAGRAALVVLMHRYLGGLMDPFVTLLEVHKLMYFMQEAGEPLRLRLRRRRPTGPTPRTCAMCCGSRGPSRLRVCRWRRRAGQATRTRARRGRGRRGLPAGSRADTRQRLRSRCRSCRRLRNAVRAGIALDGSLGGEPREGRRPPKTRCRSLCVERAEEALLATPDRPCFRDAWAKGLAGHGGMKTDTHAKKASKP